MSTSIEGRVVRPIGPDTFADITDAPVVAVTRDGLLFDGDLTPDQVVDVWERMTSADDTDQQRRHDLRTACESGATNVVELLVAYVLGLELPAAETSNPAPSEGGLVTQVVTRLI